MTYDDMRKCLEQLGLTAPPKPSSRSRVLRCDGREIGGVYANEGYLTANSGRRFPENRDYCEHAKSHDDLWQVIENCNTRIDGTGKVTPTPRCHLVPLDCRALKDFAKRR